MSITVRWHQSEDVDIPPEVALSAHARTRRRLRRLSLPSSPLTRARPPTFSLGATHAASQEEDKKKLAEMEGEIAVLTKTIKQFEEGQD